MPGKISISRTCMDSQQVGAVSLYTDTPDPRERDEAPDEDPDENPDPVIQPAGESEEESEDVEF